VYALNLPLSPEKNRLRIGQKARKEPKLVFTSLITNGWLNFFNTALVIRVSLSLPNGHATKEVN
jgi:hypothetical protein